jgi:hypothetical protein
VFPGLNAEAKSVGSNKWRVRCHDHALICLFNIGNRGGRRCQYLLRSVPYFPSERNWGIVNVCLVGRGNGGSSQRRCASDCCSLTSVSPPDILSVLTSVSPPDILFVLTSVSPCDLSSQVGAMCPCRYFS